MSVVASDSSKFSSSPIGIDRELLELFSKSIGIIIGTMMDVHQIDDLFCTWKNQIPSRSSGILNEDDFDYAIELAPDDEYR
jgi:hypothetical protein